jgi:CheY-like chemotaxis protein/anti-sigma regulatory factor (Ser/Thr protein kinase)
VPAVEANPNRIEQVLLNLLVNAAQALPATEAPGQRIVVSLRARDGLVEVAITDTGCGIPEAHLTRIFEPFFTTKPVGVGTGLGLPICRSIIRGLGGEISVRSVVGEGSTFTVTLPASTAALPEPVAKARFSSIPPARRGNVLVVDDELSVARTLRALLGGEHELTLAASGAEALHALANDAIPEFDVILCDLMMPGMSGMDLYERIRQLYPGLEQRMVFMTGGVSLDRAREFLATITNLTFEKPFDFDELRNTLRRLVEAR